LVPLLPPPTGRGWSTKAHLAVDQRHGVISFLVTSSHQVLHFRHYGHGRQDDLHLR